MFFLAESQRTYMLLALLTSPGAFGWVTDQGGHCPGNQGKVRENEKGLKWSGKSDGI